MANGPSGHIEQLPSGSWRVKVYAGTDPLTGREIRFRQTCKTKVAAQIELGKLLERALAAASRKPARPSLGCHHPAYGPRSCRTNVTVPSGPGIITKAAVSTRLARFAAAAEPSAMVTRHTVALLAVTSATPAGALAELGGF
jgi:hypothetical protein